MTPLQVSFAAAPPAAFARLSKVYAKLLSSTYCSQYSTICFFVVRILLSSAIFLYLTFSFAVPPNIKQAYRTTLYSTGVKCAITRAALMAASSTSVAAERSLLSQNRFVGI